MIFWLCVLMASLPVIHCSEGGQLDQLMALLRRQEERIDQLEQTARLQQQQVQVLQEKLGIQSDTASRVQRQVQISPAVGRTCHELRAASPAISSGYYWIDPDGVGVGDKAIRVYCNMTNGATFIPHDSEDSINVNGCPDPGCYSRNIQYNATMRQIQAITQLSAQCRQSIRYDCFESPLEHRGVTYSWWTDRNGQKQIFWAGRSSSKHTCLCGLTGTCTVKELPCNCDSMSQNLLTDQGYITNKEILPVVSVNFGNTNIASRHSVGKLECSGRVLVTGIPASCRDLQLLGHTVSGIYSVKRPQKNVDSVYCDFSKSSDSAGFEQTVSQGSSIHFHLRTTLTPPPKDEDDLIIVQNYDTELSNVGGAMDRISGIFTAPRSGLYLLITNYFLSGCCPQSNLRLFHNNRVVINGTSASAEEGHLSFSIVLSCRQGDGVYLVARRPGFFEGYLHFIGALLRDE